MIQGVNSQIKGQCQIIIINTNNNKPKQQHPASDNPTSINKWKDTASTYYQQQH